MLDPRDDTRDRGEDGRERAYEGRDQTGDPRDVFLRDVDLPLEREREYVLDRDHVYELNGDDARTLATVGAFRVIPDRNLRDGDEHLSDSLDHLREQGLIDTVPSATTTIAPERIKAEGQARVGLPAVARYEWRERKVVDLTGIEPVTS